MAQIEKKLKHLEMIQAVIARLASNSFLLKAWSVTLLAALFALAAKDANTAYILVAYIPLCVFWCLDGIYLERERRFRDLHDRVRVKPEDQIDFDMKMPDGNSFELWLRSLLSVTLAGFYLPLIGLTIVVTLVAR
ncbi:hypothetical protein [Rhodococcus pyridinivorans]|uniref:hypothetical protein n=1 Tax=Rhodococcus pyridinivorans TaxID=103816 RepID=UPI001904446A|nr:hypothetical protein [Rhodococcus pyridinivorans]QQM51882.1 hypothetical protein JGU70_15095 [Rhodococcus pyridinivorans]